MHVCKVIPVFAPLSLQDKRQEIPNTLHQVCTYVHTLLLLLVQCQRSPWERLSVDIVYSLNLTIFPLQTLERKLDCITLHTLVLSNIHFQFYYNTCLTSFFVGEKCKH
jgi:hypothetical protein